MAKAKAVSNKLTFKRKDMISSGARDGKLDGILVIQPFGLMLDVLFKTEGAAAPRNVATPLEMTLNKVVIGYTKKMSDEIALLNKDVKDFHAKDKAGDEKAASKAADLCKKTVSKLEGTLFDEMRVQLRKSAEKFLTSNKDAAFVAKSIETAGMSGFRNSRKAIYLAPGAFAFEETTDKAFDKAAGSITKGGGGLLKLAKSVSANGTASAQAGDKYLKNLASYKADDNKGPKLLADKKEREFIQDYLQHDKGTFNTFEHATEQFAVALNNFSDQLESMEKEIHGLDKLLKNKKKSLNESARSDAQKLGKAMLKSLNTLYKQTGTLHDECNNIAEFLHDDRIPTVAGKPGFVAAPIKNVRANLLTENDKSIKALAKGCDEMKRIIDKA